MYQSGVRLQRFSIFKLWRFLSLLIKFDTNPGKQQAKQVSNSLSQVELILSLSNSRADEQKTGQKKLNLCGRFVFSQMSGMFITA